MCTCHRYLATSHGSSVDGVSACTILSASAFTAPLFDDLISFSLSDMTLVHLLWLLFVPPADRGGVLDFSTLLSIMHQQLQQEAPEEEILEALRMVDKEQKGFIMVSELRAKLTGLGETLTHAEGEA